MIAFITGGIKEESDPLSVISVKYWGVGLDILFQCSLCEKKISQIISELIIFHYIMIFKVNSLTYAHT